MNPPYILIAIDANGATRAAFTATPEVPVDFTRFGEIAFVVQPLDVDARHGHQP